MSEMIEKLARNIWQETYRHQTLMNWSEIKPGTMHHKFVMNAARAALKALREPTDEMLSEADAIFNHEDCWHGEIWQAMIDAALDEKEE